VRKILVVENDDDNRDAMREALEDEGYAVETAPDGAAALARMVGELPALVVTDLVMQVMDGFEFVAEMARRGLRPPVPILVVSGSPRALRRLEEMAPDGFVAKPWDLAALLSEVARLAGPPDGARRM
jgi:CheY-like chemotaxis protein